MARDRVTSLQHAMRRRRLTRDDTLSVLSARADAMGVRDFALSLRQLDRWLAGEVGTAPRPSTCRVVEAEFGASIEALLSYVDPGPEAPDIGGAGGSDDDAGSLRETVSVAADVSARFAVWADSTRLSDLATATLHGRLAKLAADYVHLPLLPVFGRLVDLRDDLFTVIKRQPDPTRLREVYLLAGTTCAMLAYASGDLGDPRASMLQAQAALMCAEVADHPTLTAWVLGNLAMTAEWYGHPDDGLRWADQAVAHAERARVPGTVRSWLACIQARAFARLGNGADARAALETAARAREQLHAERDDFDGIGGILTFTPAKQHFYAGSVFLRIEEADAAARSAQAAIDAYATGPTEQRSYGDETLAWVDVAAARAATPRPDLDGTWQALGAIFELPASMQIPALVQPLQLLNRQLGAAPFAGSAQAGEIREAIGHFVRQRVGSGLVR